MSTTPVLYDTLLLDQTYWDIVQDASRNLAIASQPYSVAQDVASAIRTFLGELYYDTTKGVPYQSQVLGKFPPLALFTALMEQQALGVSGVVSAQCVVFTYNTGQDQGVTGQVAFVDIDGNTNAVSFGG